MINMAKMTKAQKKRMILDIDRKAKKLYFTSADFATGKQILTAADMIAIEKLCAKWMKRIA